MMKLYNWQRAPNCRRVRMFILEKGLEIPPIEEVGGKVRLSDEYIKIWPHALVPMLETDDGLRIGEAMAICRFLEDEYPDPNLMGADGREKACIEMWERRAYDEGVDRCGRGIAQLASRICRSRTSGKPGTGAADPRSDRTRQRSTRTILSQV